MGSTVEIGAEPVAKAGPVRPGGPVAESRFLHEALGRAGGQGVDKMMGSERIKRYSESVLHYQSRGDALPCINAHILPQHPS